MISVIVPVYNIPNIYLQQCLESILCQTLDDWELIIINDQSPNEQNDLLICGFCEKDRRIRYIKLKENGGVSNARNIGLSMVRGEWVTFVDADDILKPYALSIMLDEAEKHNLDVVMGNIQFDQDSWAQNVYIPNQQWNIVCKSSDANNYLQTISAFQMSALGKLYRTAFLNKLEFPAGMAHFEDWVFLWQVACRSPRYALLSEVVYEACYRENSASRAYYHLNKCVHILTSLSIALDKSNELFPSNPSVRKYITGIVLRESFACGGFFEHKTSEEINVLYPFAAELFISMKRDGLLNFAYRGLLSLRLLCMKKTTMLEPLLCYITKGINRLSFG